MNRLVLLTGATGFIGSALVPRFTAAGLQLRTTGRTAHQPQVLPGYVPADLRDTACLPGLLQDVDCVVHAAGVAHQFGAAARDMAAFTATNVTATENLVRAAAENGARHFVLISSVSVYGGNAASGEGCDENCPCRPREPYACSKLLAEERAIALAEAAGLRLTILRLATVYGEGDPGNVARLMRALERGRFMCLGSGLNRKSLIHVEDVARACLAVVCDGGDAGTAIYNVTAPPVTMREVVDSLSLALGRSAPAWHLPAAPFLWATGLARGRGKLGRLHATLQKWLADDVYSGARFAQRFNFETQIALNAGLRREVEWHRSQSVGSMR